MRLNISNENWTVPDPLGQGVIDQMAPGFKLITNQQRKRRSRRQRRNPRGGRSRERGQRREERAPKKSIGHTIGAGIGGFLGNAVGRIFGAGEYQEERSTQLSAETEQDSVDMASEPKVNSLVAPVSSRQMPTMHVSDEGTMRICRREYIGDIYTGTTATPVSTALSINPGYEPAFPWLSGVAQHFQKYSFLGLCYEYVPLSGYAVSGTSAALGSVSFAPVYDVGLQTPATNTKVELLACQGSSSGSPAAAQLIPIECAPDETVIPVKFVYSGTGTTKDLSSLWWGSMRGYNTGAPSAFTAGELWVTYDILLMAPRLPAVVANLGLTDEEIAYRDLLDQYHQALTRDGMTGLDSVTFHGTDEAFEYRLSMARFQDPEHIFKVQQARLRAEKVEYTRAALRAEESRNVQLPLAPPEEESTVVVPLPKRR